jgi:hypothetical protein
MRWLVAGILVVAIPVLSGAGAAVAQGRACFTGSESNSDPDLATGDRGVLPGRGILKQGLDEYAFNTFSIGSWDPTMQGRVCLRYDIVNMGKTSSHAQTGEADETIYSFRWHDIGLNDFRNIGQNEHFRWYAPRFTRSDALYRAPSSVRAFQKSKAVTKALLTHEQVAKSEANTNDPSEGPLETEKLSGAPRNVRL